ncbi:MAG: PD-(D/E)XK nuclease family protein [Endomicrobium sp.]|jgi:CRISPR/Cas system-associated exonuclease Cas4 (RecB family)|nr:PD-(D/E)XK nuclease family protein [Endomicrobium sp.]
MSRSKIINIDIHDNIIDYVSEYIMRLSGKTLLISGGRRPFVFIKKKLAEKYSKSFFSPEFLTNNEFIEKIIFENTKFVKISDIEASFMIFKIIKNSVPQLLNKKKSFVTFMEWSFEILSFIEQLDLENVSKEKFKLIEANAKIGYDVPENINNLLKNIFKIRKSFHNVLEKSLKITKGYSFMRAMTFSADLLTENYDEIILMAPFYLHKTEIEIFKKIYNNKKLVLFVQGNPKKYGILGHIYTEFNEPLPNMQNKKDNYNLNIYSAFDDQSQGAILKNLIKNYSEDDKDKTVIVVPDLTMLQSVISEISVITDKYNISAGYPAEKTAVFSLLNSIIEAQILRKDKYYYSVSIVKILTNPLIKNFNFLGENYISKIISYKVEEALLQNSANSLNGKIFVSFDEIINEKQIIGDISSALADVQKYFSAGEIVKILQEIFIIFFKSWENITTFNKLSNVLHIFSKKIYAFSNVSSYPLNIESIELLLFLAKDFKFGGDISKVRFKSEDILNILKELIKNKRIPLKGSPLKGLQILGLLESRNISFDNVFIVGMTDSAVPMIRKEYSLIPRDIMYTLGLEMSQKEFEIQQYHFQRLISGSKNLHLIYPDNEKNERSRFIELLIWNKQQENNNINIIKVNKFALHKISAQDSSKQKYKKTKEIREYLRNMHYTYTKIDTYLNCKLKFYFKYVLLLDQNIKIGKEFSRDDMGNFIHDFLKDVLHENLNSRELQVAEFKKEYFKRLHNRFSNFHKFKFREDSFMIKDVLMYRMGKLLHYEKMRVYKSIYACEKEYISNIKTLFGATYNLSCRIDRIDTDGENYMIFDYKTGVVFDNIISNKYFKLTSNNFLNRQNIKKGIKSLQLPLYKYIFEKETKYNASECGIYDLRRVRIIGFPQEQEIYDKCIDIIKIILDEINNEENFEFTKDDNTNCKNCQYFYICR